MHDWGIQNLMQRIDDEARKWKIRNLQKLEEKLFTQSIKILVD